MRSNMRAFYVLIRIYIANNLRINLLLLFNLRQD